MYGEIVMYVRVKHRGQRYLVIYIPRAIHKVEHAHYIRFNVVKHVQYIISRPTSERADVIV